MHYYPMFLFLFYAKLFLCVFHLLIKNELKTMNEICVINILPINQKCKNILQYTCVSLKKKNNKFLNIEYSRILCNYFEQLLDIRY